MLYSSRSLSRRNLLYGLGAACAARPAFSASTTKPFTTRDTSAPIELYDDTRVFVPATINGTLVRALLDTGAEMTVVDAKLASNLGFKLQGSGSAIGTGGSSSVRFVNEVTIEVAGLGAISQPVAVIDLSAVSQALGHPLTLLLGKDLLKNRVLDLDLPNRRLAFHASGERQMAAEGMFRSFPEVGPLRAIPVTIGGKDVQFHLDTGSGAALTIYPAFARELSLPDERPSSAILTGGVGGLHPEVILSLRTVTIGCTALSDVPAMLGNAGAAQTEHPVAGAIGMAIIARFRMIADFGGDQIAFLPDLPALAPPFWRNTIGLSLQRSGDVVRSLYVMPNSPAEAAGWLEGEEYRAINGVAATNLDMSDLRRIMGHRPGITITFETKMGNILTLQPSRFY
ncbi:aspartyl protease family protein [Sphingomonas sp. QA11]|uniref:aspartyl protease family protein n=1 Tax=Sphingomonas sp. QA11 TaxID=2950605 RepID=UPI002349A152|nr:aspartyl protease family protein [Sphingomonas sp. QA11]WCM27417.1 aspartyl protease family protein [Sphingomonas sp. QA11]